MLFFVFSLCFLCFFCFSLFFFVFIFFQFCFCECLFLFSDAQNLIFFRASNFVTISDNNLCKKIYFLEPSRERSTLVRRSVCAWPSTRHTCTLQSAFSTMTSMCTHSPFHSCQEKRVARWTQIHGKHGSGALLNPLRLSWLCC